MSLIRVYLTLDIPDNNISMIGVIDSACTIDIYQAAIRGENTIVAGPFQRENTRLAVESLCRIKTFSPTVKCLSALCKLEGAQ